jgi:hypothetical protein
MPSTRKRSNKDKQTKHKRKRVSGGMFDFSSWQSLFGSTTKAEDKPAEAPVQAENKAVGTNSENQLNTKGGKKTAKRRNKRSNK